MDRILRTNHASHLVCEKTKSVSWNSCGLQFVSSLYQQTLFARREAIAWGLSVLLARFLYAGINDVLTQYKRMLLLRSPGPLTTMTRLLI